MVVWSLFLVRVLRFIVFHCSRWIFKFKRWEKAFFASLTCQRRLLDESISQTCWLHNSQKSLEFNFFENNSDRFRFQVELCEIYQKIGFARFGRSGDLTSETFVIFNYLCLLPNLTDLMSFLFVPADIMSVYLAERERVRGIKVRTFVDIADNRCCPRKVW